MVHNIPLSLTEAAFSKKQGFKSQATKIPYILVDSFPELGLLTALRFLEWVSENPKGIISLPTGKTPEYFIKWTHHLLTNWNDKKLTSMRNNYGLNLKEKPDLSCLTFVQIDEFYPINPKQHNSFNHYIKKYYLNGMGIPEEKAVLINCDQISLFKNKPWSEVFPDGLVDLSLRYKDPKSNTEKEQQRSIFLIDQWCSEYENKINNLGGIGFFLGGIGPDGHIAFNVRGSDHNSTTRLMETNFETQAAAATDLGGIEISKNRLVITIGLGTITTNKNAVAIITAAGEAKATIVKKSLENAPDVIYPASVLQTLKNSRFYLTKGAGKHLKDVENIYWKNAEWSESKKQRALLQLAHSSNTFGKKLTVTDLKNDPICKHIPNLNKTSVEEIIANIDAKIQKGIKDEENQVFYHTGPHHDDIMLGMMPHIIHLMRSSTNSHHFANMTSGFTSVTNGFITEILKNAIQLLSIGKIQMVEFADFFSDGFKRKWDKDVFHYLDKIAQNRPKGQIRGMVHRVIRCVVKIYKIKNKIELKNQILLIINELSKCYDGENNSLEIQKLKGMVREYEEELVWANYGVRVQDIHHLRLGFYTGEIFTESPEQSRDVVPILDQLKEINPTVISLAFDPEGSGPDTHYKVLQSIADAVRQWKNEKDLSQLRIWGYRNVWYRFSLDEADLIVPVTLNSLAILNSTFMNCYLSQKNASFPSYELNGPFCDLTQKIWVEQHQDLQLLLGRDYWYQNNNPQLRAVHGAIYLKEMNVEEFLASARKLEESIERPTLNLN
ncbi:MAG: glucosamine-6-phosphate isomerase [Candidatus Marinimicrobia bacterium]|nr:glucosamine-6-phosphate isomerase [Candidatus Neomarinimicrobiota bacterium]MBT3617545.1 glucosamine-6-phosphate isomerase [Candidatus Neomarinimicrobiota bacterium]MBT3829222.1 glucosamine-6-phosphate isomerase [Candidatus Neomarinimicrobiota bacterium]MBT3996784.1 glucosamine-6-phosphate isomerase [Candidatus Neomarinimicrobiota bacterium]MBT4280346.1 glucosamine-6-phosphate isomerase [Candidatus Neomarinimicrobiota bacterium]